MAGHGRPRPRRLRLARTEAGLDAKPLKGPTPGLSDEQLVQLEQLLLQGAKHHGWPNQLWTAARVARLIEQEFKLRYHPEHVRKILKQRLGWTSQRPEQHHRDRDDKAIRRWVQETFLGILRAAAARDAPPALA